MKMIDLQQVNWQHWLQRWDTQQTGYLPHREARFTAMLDVLEVLLPPDFVAIDLACGPGSLSQRLLQRFPQAQCLAIDFDPVLLKMGQSVFGDFQGRLTWLEADLRSIDLLAEFIKAKTGGKIDAVLSTTAIHWLLNTELLGLYQQLGRLIHPGGIFLNGDNIRFSPTQPTFQRVSDTWHQQREVSSFQEQGVEDWQQWWEAIAQEFVQVPELNNLLQERHRRFGSKSVEENPTYELHQAALENAGFREVGTIWQHRDDRVLMAVR
jgi:SAM-dependent methyltransferase